MNIVFDLGGVILHWNPPQVMAKYFSDPNEHELVKNKILRHEDWAELDRGTLPLEEAITRAVARTGLPEKNVTQFLKDFPKALTPKSDVLSIAQKIYDSQQHDLYVLSNMHLHAMHYIEQVYDFWYLFKGIVFSSPLKLIKPEPEIYSYLLNKYNLSTKDSIFIDDREENTIAAERLGFETIHFQDSEQCAKELKTRLSFS